MRRALIFSAGLIAGVFMTANSAKSAVEEYVPEVIELDIPIRPIEPVVPVEMFDWAKLVEADHEMRAFSLSLTENDIREIAQITMAEAENQDEKGKRLVIDTILNRVDHEAFPDSVHGVIFQKGQFQPVTNGRYYNCYVTEENYNLVKEEVDNRTNSDVIFFQAGGYSPYGSPLFKYGDHYFNKY